MHPLMTTNLFVWGALALLAIGKRVSRAKRAVVENEEETVSNTVMETDKAANQTVSPAKTSDGEWISISDNGLRRGDRFICPDTGKILQVRGLGGRPRKG